MVACTYVNLKTDWSIDIEGTRSGWYRLRVAPPKSMWSHLSTLPPYRHRDAFGTVIYRTQDLGTIRQFLDKPQAARGSR